MEERQSSRPIVLLSGGVGGARLARGLAAVLDPADLTVVVNVGDDAEFYGLHVSPDLDTVVYTLAGAHSFSDEKAIRRTAIAYRVPCITIMSAAKAVAEAVASRRRDPIRVWSLQEIHAREKTQAGTS